MIIEDDEHIGNLLEEALTKQNYQVSRAYSGTEAMYILKQSRPDLILLDLMLPGLNGENILPSIQDIPVIVMSAKADVQHKVELLLEGAADYVTKPFHMDELLARIVVQLRKSETYYIPPTITFENIVLHTDTHLVTIDNQEVKLTRTEYAILKLLMQNAPRVVTKSFFLEHMSIDTPDCSESSLKMHISHLRKKLKMIDNKDYIEAVWGIGFKLRNE